MTIAQRTILNLMGKDNSVTTIWPVNSRDEWGKYSYGPPYLVYCEMKSTKGITRNSNGEERLFKQEFFTELDDSTSSIKEGDRIKKGDNTLSLDPLSIGADDVLSITSSTGVLPSDKLDLVVRC